MGRDLLTAPLLALDRVSLVTGATRLLDAVSLEIGTGDRVAVIGDSGVGKSMLLRLAIGLIAPLAGTVSLFGDGLADADSVRRRLLRSRCGVVFQGPSLISDLSVEDNLWLGFASGIGARKRLQARLDRISLDFGIEHIGSIAVDALSAGERRRVELARAFLRDPELVLLDEPLEGARAGAAQLEVALQRHVVSRNRALLLLTQDAALAERLCNRILRLDEGRLGGGLGQQSRVAVDTPSLA